MKQAMVKYIQSPKNDELYTPIEAIEPLVEYISKDKIIWEPTDFGESQITRLFKSCGNEVVTSHMKDGQNFFNYQPEKFDIIITNPPYSCKTKFIERCYDLGKPFALLLPLTALEGIDRSLLYRKYGIEVLVLDKRINFMSGKKNVWFNTSWFCKGILPDKLVFKSVGKSVNVNRKIKINTILREEESLI